MHNDHFRPKDGYFLNQHGWWFYTKQAIGGPFADKQACVQACFRFIRTHT